MDRALTFGAALLAALALTPIAARTARRAGAVDRPGPLKVHAQPVPYLGGLAVLGALVVALAPTRPALLLPLGLVAALGLADDVTDLPPRLRLAGEVAVGVVGGLVVPATDPTALGVVLTAGAVVGLVNAVNLLDGLDGLAAGTAAASALGLAAAGGETTLPALALVGALLGFLAYNRPPARIYLGDSGSYLVGTALALLGASVLGDDLTAVRAAAVPLVVAVPVVDTAIALVRRRRAGRALFQGDRSHVYDQLVDRGWSPTRTVVGCVAAQAVLAAAGAVALATDRLPAALPALALGYGALALVLRRGRFAAVAARDDGPA